MRKSILTATLAIFAVLFWGVPSAQAQDNTGKEFYFTLFAETFLDHLPGVYVVGNYDATVTIDYVARDPLQDQAGDPQCTQYTFNLIGGTPQFVNIPYDLQALCFRYVDDLDTPETIRTNGIKVTSTAPIALYSQFFANASSEMTPILPSSEMGTDYIVSAYREITSDAEDFNARTTVVGMANNTTVTFTLPNYTWTSFNANLGMKRAPGSTWTITLNEGETYTILSNDNGQLITATPAGSSVTVDNNQGLNGLRISATNPISVLGGTDCTWAGNDEYPGCGACDLTCTHFRPITKWSDRYVTTQTLVRPLQTSLLVGLAASTPNIEPYPAGFNNMSVADYLMITAKDNGTVVNISGVNNYSKTLNAGQWFIYESPGISNPTTPPPLTSPGASHHLVTANNPIQVVQMMKGWQCDNVNPADPTQMLVMEETLWRDNYIIANPTQYVNNFFAFIIKEPNGNADARNTLNLVVAGVNVPIPTGASPTGDGVAGWTQIGTTPYYFQRIAINAGAAIKARSNPTTPGGPTYPFAFYASGSTNASSYGYMGGAICNLEIFGGATPDTICLGDDVLLHLDSTRNGGTVAGQELWDYTWDVFDAAGNNVFTTNGLAAQVDETYTTTASGNLTAIVDVVDIAGCLARDTFQFFVNTPPQLDDPADFASCNSAVLPQATGTNLTGNQAYYTGTGATGTQYLPGVTVTNTGTYYLYDSSGVNCFSEQDVVVTVNTSPTVDPITVIRNCDAANLNYTLSFVVTGGNGGPYTVNEIAPGVGGAFTGNTYTTNNIPSGTAYHLEISDANGCPPAILTGVRNCLCTGDAGTMSATLTSTCDALPLSGTSVSPPLLDANDASSFVLHTAPGGILGTVLATSTTPTFNFIGGTMTYGTTYYISRVVGDDLGTGEADLTDGCLAVAPGTPAVWYEPVVVAMTNNGPVCEQTNGNLDFNISGASPFNITYTDGTNNFNVLNVGSTVTEVVTPNGTTTYTALLVTSLTSGCVADLTLPTATTTMTTWDTPTEVNRTETCSADNAFYTVSFDVQNGQAPYTVNTIAPGGITGTFVGATWTSNPIPSGQAYQFDLSDDNACGTTIVQGLTTCICLSNAGGMVTDPLSICGDGIQSGVVNQGQVPFLDGNDVLGFVLHDGAGNVLGNVFGQSVNPDFSFNDLIMTFGDTYYISAVVGNDDGTGNVDLSDPCLNVAPGTPVVWNETPEATATQNGPICSGETLSLTGGNTNNLTGVTYSWTGPNGFFSNEQSPVVTNVPANSAGTYSLIASLNGCTSQTDIQVVVHPSAVASFNSNLLNEVSEPHLYEFINTSSNAVAYLWDFGDGETSVENSPTHQYVEESGSALVQLIAVNANGCNDTILVNVDLLVIPENDTVLTFIPNSFTPDGNEYNQDFKPVFNESIDLTEYSMKIFNRWGEVIFESKDPNIGWDGSYKSMQSPVGLYNYVVRFKDKYTLKDYQVEGYVNLIE